jgi:hypothetical protein
LFASVFKDKTGQANFLVDESRKRLVAGAESSVLGHGGIATVSKATGLARNTIKQGQKDLEKLKGKLSFSSGHK